MAQLLTTRELVVVAAKGGRSRELDKVRPIIVLTRDPMGRLLGSVIVAPFTSTVRGESADVPVGLEVGIQHRPTRTLSKARSLVKPPVNRAFNDSLQPEVSPEAMNKGSLRN
jgi:mRNA-degrading endonuclease toxin of MazEF toxin-antitoxin module